MNGILWWLLKQMGDYRPFFLKFFGPVTIDFFLYLIGGLNFTNNGVDIRGVRAVFVNT